MTTIRLEEPGDVASIRDVNERAFDQPEEANIVDHLRETCGGLLSFVAVVDEQVVGHILFSPATIEQDGKAIEGMGLAPMAVIPEHQRRGIGSSLVETGLDILRDSSCPFVIVLGHPEYYPRFGFETASRHGITCQWDGVPDEAFMILVFDQNAMKHVSGVARYRDEFGEAM